MTKPASRLLPVHRLVASWFGSGFIIRRFRDDDLGSGTVGAFFAFPFAYLIGQAWGWPTQIAAAVLIAAASLWAAKPFVDEEGDAGWICVDEAAGAFICVIGLPFWPAVAAWVIFRLADIYKHFAPGVAQAERVPGALGVTLDDVVAGLYGLAAGHLLFALL